jgi:predicted MPP superfamily phosphohydrolase
MAAKKKVRAKRAKKPKRNVVLTISDMHVPYHHPDALAFLKALKKKYKPTTVICLGDMLDFHNISFHDSDPELFSAGDELKEARKHIKTIEKLFPEMVIVGSNHGDLPLRKLFAAGLPKEFLKSYNEIYGVGKKWKFVDDYSFQGVYYCHGISKSGIKLAAQRAQSCVQGHYHTDFRIDYISNPKNLLWSMQIGCLIDDEALAFAYNKLQLTRPIIGTGVVVEGVPQLVPMLLNKKGRWIGSL